MSPVTEAAFEAHIAGWLVEHGGYRRAKIGNVGDGPRDFDAEAGVDTADLFEFIGATQAREWERLVDTAYGGGAGKAQSGFVQRLAAELDKRGTVDVLRRGVVDRNVTIRLAYFRPAHALAPDLAALYDANVLSVTRQLPFDPSSSRTVDLGLFVNGVPVATAELKNPLTGQSVENAVAQYRSDRPPNNRTLGRVGMVHFAVDPSSVMMTTRLAGTRTRFLPFNRGCDLGAGNPPNPEGHRTAYLWEQVWNRDAWMDVLGRFVHVVTRSKGSRARPDVIFPRFHQWDAVRRLEADAKERGPGHSYLVQHSAGSGKSNSIAWLAHRLSSLHSADDAEVFHKVVVITDRVVLDRHKWQIMVVAEKFQTGFDQPKLAAMYVDKTLTGLAAVQTLSRLNRIHPDKSATFVMDFVNDAEEIGDAFAVYHGKTVAAPTDPNLLFDTRRDLDRFGVLDTGEIERAAALLLGEGAHARVDAALQPAVDRFNGLEDEDQDAFRDALGRFVRVYRFLSLVVPFRNPGLERDYLFCRALAALIRNREHGQGIDLGSEVELTHLRHEITFEGSIELPGGEGEVTTIFSGTGPAADPEHERLSQIIARINERFGTDWTDEDRLVFEAAAGDLVADIEIQNQAVNNDEATFRGPCVSRALPQGLAVTARPQQRPDLQLPRQRRAPSRGHGHLRGRGAKACHCRPPTDLSHRRLAGPRPGVAVLGVQVHPALGHPPAAQGRRR